MLDERKVLDQISNLTSNLICSGLCIDQNFPVIKEYSEKVKEVTISGCDYSITLKNIPYSDMYQELKSSKSYNILLIDGALIQMQYRFKNNFLEKHRLAFFPAPNLHLFQNEQEIYNEDEIYGDVVDARVVTTPIRFDFDDSVDSKGVKVAKPVSHPISHLTLGQYKNCRIPVNSALTPYQFIEFILRNFYNSEYLSYKNPLKNNVYFSDCIYEEEKKIVNICFPK